MKKNILFFVLGAVITAAGFISYKHIDLYLFDTAVPTTYFGYQLGDMSSVVIDAINDNGATSQGHSSIEDRWDFSGKFTFDGRKWDTVKLYYDSKFKVSRLDFVVLCPNQTATNKLFADLQKQYLRAIRVVPSNEDQEIARKYNGEDILNIEKFGLHITISFIRNNK